MKKYEHQVMPVTYNGDIQGLAQDDSILNGLGKEGWVLVSAVPVAIGEIKHDPPA
jgi:hypothetical protein